MAIHCLHTALNLRRDSTGNRDRISSTTSCGRSTGACFSMCFIPSMAAAASSSFCLRVEMQRILGFCKQNSRVILLLKIK